MPAKDFIGLTGPEYEMDVERGRIRDFAKAMSAPLPEFTTNRNPVIPATFLVTTPYTWGYSLERPRYNEAFGRRGRFVYCEAVLCRSPGRPTAPWERGTTTNPT